MSIQLILLNKNPNSNGSAKSTENNPSALQNGDSEMRLLDFLKMNKNCSLSQSILKIFYSKEEADAELMITKLTAQLEGIVKSLVKLER